MTATALDVTARWGDVVLAARHLHSGDLAIVGDGPDDFTVVPDGVEIESFVFAGVQGESARVELPRGTRAWINRPGQPAQLLFGPSEHTLSVGESIKAQLGKLLLEAHATHAEAARSTPMASLRGLHWTRVVAAAALAHAGLLGLGGLASLYADEPTPDVVENRWSMTAYLAATGSAPSPIGETGSGDVPLGEGDIQPAEPLDPRLARFEPSHSPRRRTPLPPNAPAQREPAPAVLPDAPRPLRRATSV